MKPAAKVATDYSNDVVASAEGKYSLPMITAKKPYTVKSKNSSQLPITAAAIAPRLAGWFASTARLGWVVVLLAWSSSLLCLWAAADCGFHCRTDHCPR